VQGSLQALHQRHDDRRVIAAIGTNRVEDKRQPSLRAQLWIEQPGLAIVDAAHVQRRNATQATEQHTVQIEHAYCRARVVDRRADGLYRDFGHLPHAIENVGAGELFIVEIEAVE